MTKFDETMKNLEKECESMVTKKDDKEKEEPEEDKVVDVTYLIGK